MVNRARAAEQLELHEGLRLKIYLDTEGNETLGVGYNVTARRLEDFTWTIKRKIVEPLNAAGDLITAVEARQQLAKDIVRVEQAVMVHFTDYINLDEVRQRVILDLAFNLGFRALTFKACIAAILKRNWSVAARELYKSKWAYQVDDGPGGHLGRADRLATMLLTGHDYTC